MDHNDRQDDVKHEGTAKTACQTNGQRCQRPRSAIVWQKRTDGNVDGVAKSNEMGRWWENEQTTKATAKTGDISSLFCCCGHHASFASSCPLFSLLSLPFVQDGN